MKKIYLLLLILCSIPLWGVEQSNESNNPFNKNAKIAGEVDLFSGNTQMNIPLVSIGGPTSYSMNLLYSSNVYNNIRSENGQAQSGWVGMGWDLSLPKVYRDSDNSFTFISYGGVGYRVKGEVKPEGEEKEGEEAKIIGLRDWKIHRSEQIWNKGSELYITSSEGMKFTFRIETPEDPNDPSISKYYLKSLTTVNHDSVLFNYAFDFKDVDDFEKHKIEGYLSDVTIKGGEKVEFYHKKKTSSEIKGDYPEYFLDSIATYDVSGELKSGKKLCYILLNNPGSPETYGELMSTDTRKFTKRAISKIIESTPLNNERQHTRFSYYTDKAAWAEEEIEYLSKNGKYSYYNPDGFPYGLLKSVKTKTGGEKVFHYRKQYVQNSKAVISDLVTAEKHGAGFTVLKTARDTVPSAAFQKEVFNSENKDIQGGEWFTIRGGGDKENTVWEYWFSGSKWYDYERPFSVSDLVQEKSPTPAKDKGDEYEDGEKKEHEEENKLITDLSEMATHYKDIVGPQNTEYNIKLPIPTQNSFSLKTYLMFILTGRNFINKPEDVDIRLVWNGSLSVAGLSDDLDYEYHNAESVNNLNYWSLQKYIEGGLLKGGVAHTDQWWETKNPEAHFCWMYIPNKNRYGLKQGEDTSMFNYGYQVSGNKYSLLECFETDHRAPKVRYRAHHKRNGVWKKSFNDDDNLKKISRVNMGKGLSAYPYSNSAFHAIRYFGESKLRILYPQKNGDWYDHERHNIKGMPFKDDYMKIYTGSDYFVETYPNVYWFLFFPDWVREDNIRIYQWENDQVTTVSLGNVDHKHYKKSPKKIVGLSHSYFLVETLKEHGINKDKRDIFLYKTGKEGKHSWGNQQIIDIVDAEILSDRCFIDKRSDHVIIYTLYNNQINNKPYNYVTYAVETKDLVTKEAFNTFYEYDSNSDNFNYRTNCLTFNKATVTQKGYSKNVSYFMNETDFNNQEKYRDYHVLSGNHYMSESFIKDNKYPKTVSKIWYTLKGGEVVPEKQLKSDKGLKSSTVYEFNDNVQLVKESSIISTDVQYDKEPVLLKTVIAQDELNEDFLYTQFLKKNIVNPTFGEVVRKIGNDNSDTILSATANTWTYDEEEDLLLPEAEWIWKSDDHHEDNFIAFNYTNPHANVANGWEKMSENTKYLPNGKPYEVKSYNGKYSYSQTGHNNLVKSAEVVNTSADGSAILTGDYIDVRSSYVDSIYGWTYGQMFSNGFVELFDKTKNSSLSNLKHFADNNLHIYNSEGPSKTIVFEQDSVHYTFSAWVYPLNTNDVAYAPEANSQIRLMLKTKDQTGLFLGDKGTVFDNLTPNVWQKITYNFDAHELENILGGECQLSIGSSSSDVAAGQVGNFLIEDLRFLPFTATATTTYYEPGTLRKITTVDGNNQYLQFEYDDYGRVTKELFNSDLVKEYEYGYVNLPKTVNNYLASLTFKDQVLNFSPETKTYSLTVDNAVTDFEVTASAASDDATIKIIANGKTVSSSCPCDQTLAFSLTDDQMAATVTVIVNDAVEEKYTVHIKRRDFCWIKGGEDFNAGHLTIVKSPRGGIYQDQLVAATLENDISFQTMNNTTGNWTTIYSQIKDDHGILTFTLEYTNSNSPIVTYTTELGALKTVLYNGSAWDIVGDFKNEDIEEGVIFSQYESLSSTYNSTEDAHYVTCSYIPDLSLENFTATTIGLKYSIATNSWEELGSIATNGKSADIAFVNNELYVAVIAPFERSIDQSKIPDGSDVPSELALDAVIVKKYDGSSWNIVGEPLTPAFVTPLNSVSLAEYDGKPAVGFACQRLGLDEETNNEVPSSEEYVYMVKVYDESKSYQPKRSTTGANSNWIPLGETQDWNIDNISNLPQDLFILHDDAAYEFSVQKDTAFITFQTSFNDDEVSVIYFDETEKTWLPKDNPGIVEGASSGVEDQPFSYHYVGDTPVLEFENSKRASNSHSVMSFVGGCEKAILASATVKEVGGSDLVLDHPFRNYILNYEGEVAQGIESVEFNLLSFESDASITVNGNRLTNNRIIMKLNNGINIFKIVVQKSIDTDTYCENVYTFDIYKPKSDDIDNVSIIAKYKNSGKYISIIPSFNVNNFGPYTVLLSQHSGPAVLSPTMHNGEKVLVDGIEVENKGVSVDIDPEIGEPKNVIASIISENGENRQDYDFTFIRNEMKPTLYFRKAQTEIDESGGKASVELLMIPVAESDVSFTYAINSTVSSATNGEDYTPVKTGIITIPAKTESTILDFLITDDLLKEGDEKFTFTLEKVSGTFELGQNASHTVTIKDNDIGGEDDIYENNVILVDNKNTNPIQDGLTWETAYSNLQDALNQVTGEEESAWDAVDVKQTRTEDPAVSHLLSENSYKIYNNSEKDIDLKTFTTFDYYIYEPSINSSNIDQLGGSIYYFNPGVDAVNHNDAFDMTFEYLGEANKGSTSKKPNIRVRIALNRGYFTIPQNDYATLEFGIWGINSFDQSDDFSALTEYNVEQSGENLVILNPRGELLKGNKPFLHSDINMDVQHKRMEVPEENKCVIGPSIKIFNNGTDPIPLSDLVIDYYFYHEDYAQYSTDVPKLLVDAWYFNPGGDARDYVQDVSISYRHILDDVPNSRVNGRNVNMVVSTEFQRAHSIPAGDYATIELGIIPMEKFGAEKCGLEQENDWSFNDANYDTYKRNRSIVIRTKDGERLWGNAPTDKLPTSIWVAKGRNYYPATRSGFTVKPDVDVNIFGGFSGYERSLDDRNLSTGYSVLSGDIDFDGVQDNKNAHSLITVWDDLQLDGFMLTDVYCGEAEEVTNSRGHYGEGPIKAFDTKGDLVIRNCKIVNNVAIEWLGTTRETAVLYYKAHSTNSTPSVILDNVKVDNNRILQSQSQVFSSVYMFGIYGAGANANPNVSIMNSIISNNDALGGNVFSFEKIKKTKFTNCIVVNNKGNNTFSNCESLVFSNSTIYDNSSIAEPVTIDNSIIWKTDFSASESNVSFSFTEKEGDGNVYSNEGPKFISYPSEPSSPEELHLHENSKCINSGNDGSVDAELHNDILGNPRIQNGAVDMGAIESSHGSMAIIYVDDDANGSNTGDSWGNAYNHLQDALAKGRTLIGETVVIKVAEGIYTPDKGNVSDDVMNTRLGDPGFTLFENVCLKGGYPNGGGTDSEREYLINNKDYSTELSGLLNDGSRSSVLIDWPLIGTKKIRIEGFKMVNAQQTIIGNPKNGKSGTRTTMTSDVIISDCYFEGFETVNCAVAFDLMKSKLKIYSSYFSNFNTPLNRTIIQVEMDENSADVLIDGCQFERNSNAFSILSSSQPGFLAKKGISISDCVFNENTLNAYQDLIGIHNINSCLLANVQFNNNIGPRNYLCSITRIQNTVLLDNLDFANNRVPCALSFFSNNNSIVNNIVAYTNEFNLGFFRGVRGEMDSEFANSKFQLQNWQLNDNVNGEIFLIGGDLTLSNINVSSSAFLLAHPILYFERPSTLELSNSSFSGNSLNENYVITLEGLGSNSYDFNNVDFLNNTLPLKDGLVLFEHSSDQTCSSLNVDTNCDSEGNTVNTIVECVGNTSSAPRSIEPVTIPIVISPWK